MQIRLSKSAMKSLLKSDKRVLIKQKIDEITKESLLKSSNIKKLQGRSELRLRVQNWRVIFRIEDVILWTDDIAPRGSANEVIR